MGIRFGAMMNPEKRIKKKTRTALITCTVAFVFEKVANTKRSSFIETLKVKITAIKIKKFCTVVVRPTIK